MRNNLKNPTIATLVHKSGRKISLNEKGRRTKKPEQNGHYIRLTEIPGNFQLFIPDGSDENKLKAEYLERHKNRLI